MMVTFSLPADQKKLRANAQAFAQTLLSSAPKLYSSLATQIDRFQSTLPIYQTIVQAVLVKGQIPIPLGGTSKGLIDAAVVVEEFHAVEHSTAITIVDQKLSHSLMIYLKERSLWLYTERESARSVHGLVEV
jgi:alkylation response protein AidB-like acyl-CoA dehydrogenase